MSLYPSLAPLPYVISELSQILASSGRKSVNGSDECHRIVAIDTGTTSQTGRRVSLVRDLMNNHRIRLKSRYRTVDQGRGRPIDTNCYGDDSRQGWESR